MPCAGTRRRPDRGDQVEICKIVGPFQRLQRVKDLDLEPGLGQGRLEALSHDGLVIHQQNVLITAGQIGGHPCLLCRLGFDRRKVYVERASPVRFAVGINRPTIALHDPVDHGQTQPGSRFLLLGMRNPDKGFKDLIKFLLRYSHTTILHIQVQHHPVRIILQSFCVSVK